MAMRRISEGRRLTVVGSVGEILAEGNIAQVAGKSAVWRLSYWGVVSSRDKYESARTEAASLDAAEKAVRLAFAEHPAKATFRVANSAQWGDDVTGDGIELREIGSTGFQGPTLWSAWRRHLGGTQRHEAVAPTWEAALTTARETLSTLDRAFPREIK